MQGQAVVVNKKRDSARGQREGGLKGVEKGRVLALQLAQGKRVPTTPTGVLLYLVRDARVVISLCSAQLRRVLLLHVVSKGLLILETTLAVARLHSELSTAKGRTQ